MSANVSGESVVESVVESDSAGLQSFNALPDAEAHALLTACVDIEWWVRNLVELRPYPSVAAIQDAAASTAVKWSGDDIVSALASRPQLGAQIRADNTFSTAEQADVLATDQGKLEAIRLGNIAYLARFNMIFMIRAAGRGTVEVLAELNRRLLNTPEDEIVEVARELCDIGLRRLESSIRGLAAGDQ